MQSYAVLDAGHKRVDLRLHCLDILDDRGPLDPAAVERVDPRSLRPTRLTRSWHGRPPLAVRTTVTRPVCARAQHGWGPRPATVVSSKWMRRSSPTCDRGRLDQLNHGRRSPRSAARHWPTPRGSREPTRPAHRSRADAAGASITRDNGDQRSTAAKEQRHRGTHERRRLERPPSLIAKHAHDAANAVWLEHNLESFHSAEPSHQCERPSDPRNP